MRKILVTMALMLGAVSAASAASPSVPKRTVTATSSKYWLSDGLNRLVFWQPTSSSHSERPAHQ